MIIFYSFLTPQSNNLSQVNNNLCILILEIYCVKEQNELIAKEIKQGKNVNRNIQ